MDDCRASEQVGSSIASALARDGVLNEGKVSAVWRPPQGRVRAQDLLLVQPIRSAVDDKVPQAVGRHGQRSTEAIGIDRAVEDVVVLHVHLSGVKRDAMTRAATK